MKLNFVCFNLSGNGGIETVIVKVANECVKRHTVSIFLTNKPSNNVWLNNMDKNIRIIENDKNGKINKLLFILKIFLSAKNDQKFIILGANVIRLAKYIRNILGKKWTITSWIHFSLDNQSMFNPKNIVYADNHWAISSSIKNQMIKLGINSNKIDLLFNPVTEYNGNLNMPIENGVLNLVFVGHIMLDGQKNLRELMSGVAEFGKQIQVDFYGSPDELLDCKNYSRSIGIQDQLVWHDWTTDPWVDILKNVHPDALVLTSKFEGLPMVILEAHSRGLPVITSNFDGYRDVVYERVNGISYQLGNLSDFVQKLHQVKNVNFDSRDVQKSTEFFYDSNFFERLDQAISKL